MNLNSVGLPTLGTYEQALEHYDKVVPFRSGGAKGRRPLGSNRRYTYCQIRKYETGAIALSLYDSDVITFYPNGETHISLCKWDTAGTRTFIYGTTPYDVKHSRGTTYLGVGSKWYAFADNESPLIIRDGDVVNPTQEKVYKSKTGALKDKRKKYSAFREYVKNMGNVLTAITHKDVESVAQGLPVEERVPFGAHRVQKLILPLARNRYYHGSVKPIDGITLFLREVEKAQENDDLEGFYRLFIHLGVSALSYHSRLEAFTSGWSDSEVEIGKPMLAFFDEVLKYVYKEDLFTEVDVPIGVKVSNVNRKYFN